MARGRKTGGGSRKGVPNKVTQTAKQALALAFDEIGGAKALAEWARDNRTEFYKLYARLIPTEITGPNDAPLNFTLLVPTKAE